MSSFPKLIPAFTAHVVLEAPITVGNNSRGAPLTVVPFTSANSFIRSESSYPIKVNSVFIHGSDFIRQDPSGKHVRLDVTSVLKDESGAIISFKYSGVINVTPGVAAVLGGSPDAKTTDFGDAFTHVSFETGSDDLRALEEKVYVASGRFIVEAGKPPVVEYKISEVGAGKLEMT